MPSTTTARTKFPTQKMMTASPTVGPGVGMIALSGLIHRAGCRIGMVSTEHIAVQTKNPIIV